MSRIGKVPVLIPEGVKVRIKENSIEVQGPKGALIRNIHANIRMNIEDDKILVTRPDDSKMNKSLHGLSRALIYNMVKGVTDGFEKKLLIVGVGYKAVMEGKGMVLSLGYSHSNKVKPVSGISLKVENNNSEITISGVDKELVGQVAANIRDLRKPDPYKGKGIRYSDEVIIKKAGKTGAGGK